MASKALEIGSVRSDALSALERLGAKPNWVTEGGVPARSPLTGEVIGRLHEASEADVGGDRRSARGLPAMA